MSCCRTSFLYSIFLCALFFGLGDFTRILLFAPFTLSVLFTSLSLSPLYPYHLSIPFTSLSLSPRYPFHLSLSLNYLSLPLYISPSTFLSLSLLLSIILFGVSNGRFRPCFIILFKRLTTTKFPTSLLLKLIEQFISLVVIGLSF